jgi:hypothetical protein
VRKICGGGNYTSKYGISGKVLSTDDEAAEQYSELFYNLVEQHKLFPTQIYSADETRLF